MSFLRHQRDILSKMKRVILIFTLIVFAGCADKKPGVTPPNAIWPYEFYNKFNLRTIVSSYANKLRYYCASYPKDFFRPDQLYMPNSDKIIIYDENRSLSFELISSNQVIIVDKVKDKYDAQHLYTIYYNEEADDYRADTFFIKMRENCVNLVLKQDGNVSK